MLDTDKFKRYIRIGVSNGEFAGFGITALDYLRWYNHLIMSRERPDKIASAREMRQWIKDGAVVFNNPDIDDNFYKETDETQLLKLPLRAVLFPKNKAIMLPLMKFQITEVSEPFNDVLIRATKSK